MAKGIEIDEIGLKIGDTFEGILCKHETSGGNRENVCLVVFIFDFKISGKVKRP